MIAKIIRSDTRLDLVAGPNSAASKKSGRRGSPLAIVPDTGLLKNTLSSLVQRHLKKSGVEKSGSCHLFRHTCATVMLEGGADIRYTQAMLGHANLSSTEIYTHAAITKLKEIHAVTHPGAKLKGTARTAQALDIDK